MSTPSSDNGQLACDKIRERLQELFPEMTFRVTPQNGTVPFRIILPGTIRIFGQRTQNMRYDRGNHYASFDVPGADYIAADHAANIDTLLKSAVVDLHAQLRMRNQ